MCESLTGRTKHFATDLNACVSLMIALKLPCFSDQNEVETSVTTETFSDGGQCDTGRVNSGLMKLLI